MFTLLFINYTDINTEELLRPFEQSQQSSTTKDYKIYMIELRKYQVSCYKSLLCKTQLKSVLQVVAGREILKSSYKVGGVTFNVKIQ